MINEQLQFNFGYDSMGYCGIGYYVTLGVLALGIMALSIMTLGIMTCNLRKHSKKNETPTFLEIANVGAQTCHTDASLPRA